MCHLASLIERVARNASPGKLKKLSEDILSTVKLSIDRFHFQNHVDAECRKRFNPEQFRELIDQDTEVCEQASGFVCAVSNFQILHPIVSRYKEIIINLGPWII